MRLLDEKSETPGERGDQEECRDSADGDSYSGSRQACGGHGHLSITPNRDDRQRGNTNSGVITAVTGGILQQLIVEAKEELASSETRVDQLRQRLQNLEGLVSRLESDQ